MSARVEFYESAGPPEQAEYRWRLRSANGEIVASGEAYTRMEDAERGFLDAASVMYTVADQLKRVPKEDRGVQQGDLDAVARESLRDDLDRNPGAGPND